MRRLTNICVIFLTLFTLWTHILPQFAEWRSYYSRFNGEPCTAYVEQENGRHARKMGAETYGADFMWSRLKWDFYYECPPISTNN